MTSEWLGTSADPGGIADLVVRRQWGKAIDILRERLLEGQVPSVQGRLQMADLLVMAGRDREAVPILLGMADEFAAEQFLAKAIAILKRIERIEPGRSDVTARLASLVEEQARLAKPTVALPTRRRMAPLDVGVSAGADVSADGVRSPMPAEETAAGSGEVAPSEATSLASESASPVDRGEAEETGVRDRLRGVLRRFLGFGGGVTPAPAEAEVAPASAEATREPEAGALEAGPGPEGADGGGAAGEVAAAAAIADGTFGRGAVEVEVDEGTAVASAPPPSEGDARGLAMTGCATEVGEGEPTIENESTEIVIESAALEPYGSASTALLPAEPFVDEELHEQILDLVEDVLRRPAPRPVARAATRSDAELAARLVAVPLFGGLSSAELLAVVRGLSLRTFEAGDVLVNEGERGQSLLILTSGKARILVRSLDGHAVEVGLLGEGDFFGEMSAIAGGRRGASVTAATACEVLELEKAVLDEIARTHPRVRELLEETYIRRAEDPETAAVRAARLAVGATPRKAVEVLESRFGASRWDPRMRLRLADVLVKAGQYDEAVPILVSLADDMARHGYPEKAIALVKKIERIQRRHIEELPLAPLAHVGAEGAAERARPAVADEVRRGDAGDPFVQWLLRLAREVVENQRAHEGAPETRVAPAPPGYAPGLKASPLFADFSEEELLELVRGLRLVTFHPGEIIVSEGEPGHSLFVLATGAVKVFTRDAGGRSLFVGRLEEGDFFGEIATLSGRPRSATVTAVESCDLLELERDALDAIAARHPRVREVLENAYLERAGGLSAERERASREGS